jgi:4'-phosphopantetheinyl transferase EntD
MGVDIEAADRVLHLDVAETIAVAEERAWIEGGEEGDRRLRTLILFTAKECIYKAFAPWSEGTLRFRDVALHRISGGFSGVFLGDAGPRDVREFEVATVAWNGFLISWMVVRR